jgi:hypothetical protein
VQSIVSLHLFPQERPFLLLNTSYQHLYHPAGKAYTAPVWYDDQGDTDSSIPVKWSGHKRNIQIIIKFTVDYITNRYEHVLGHAVA